MSKASQGILTGLLLALALTGTTLANAQPPRAVAARPMIARPHPGPGINRQEAARIRHQVQEHHHMQRRANVDGELSRHEKALLARDAAQVRKLIHTAGKN